LSNVKKLLIPSMEPGGLDAEIYPHWRGAPVFTQVVLEGDRVASVEVRRLGSDELIVDLVRREGIGFVVAKALSTRALEMLTRLGVRVLKTSARTVREAVSDFVSRRLCLWKLECVPMSELDDP